MIPVELELHNFLAYRDPGPLNFEGIHIACLAGPNGAGKSSLLDAITWAIWGRARSNSPDDLVHQGQSEMRVALTIDLSGSRFRVIRQRRGGKRGTSLLELQGWDEQAGSWRGLSEPSLRATQEKIEALLRLDHDTFVNSAFLVQGRADEFTTKTPAQRKQVLSNILGLAQWEVFEDRTKERAAHTRADIQRLEGRLEEIDRELARRAEYEAELSAAEEEARRAAEQVSAAEQTWASLEQTRTHLVSLQRQIDDLTRRITAREREVAEAGRELDAVCAQADTEALTASRALVQQALGELDALQRHWDEINRQALALAQEAAQLKGINQNLGPETEPLKSRAAVLEAATEPSCPTCGQPLTEEHRLQLLSELRAEIEHRREQYRSNQARIRELEAEAGNLEREAAGLSLRLQERGALEKRTGELSAALAHADEAIQRAASIQKRIERWSGELEEDRRARDLLEAEAETMEQALRAAALRPEDLERLRLEKRLADERVGGARQKLAALAAFERQRQDRLRERERLVDDLALYQDLREAFGKRGVPAMIIETVVPELEVSANELLSRMTDGRLNVRIETQREIKTGELREALDIIISDELGSRPYEMYSGGEAFRINFAIRIALSRLLARRAGAQLRCLFIDEGFGTQDERGREHLVSAINSVQHDFDRILVITHIDELKDAFPARIEVRKTPNGSTFSLS
ncbi:MAG: SMC family ATPase [Chloroflexota bacterium]